MEDEDGVPRHRGAMPAAEELAAFPEIQDMLNRMDAERLLPAAAPLAAVPQNQPGQPGPAAGQHGDEPMLRFINANDSDNDDDDLLFDAPLEEGATIDSDSASDGRLDLLNDEPMSEVPDVFKCSICFEMLLDPTTINCGHSFCRICLARWFDARKTARQAFVCPECRKQWIAFPEVDYSLRSAIEIWYTPEMNRRRAAVSIDDRAIVARFITQGPATFANGGMPRRVINQRILPINAQGVQFVLAILMNVALILGLILISLVAVIVTPGDEHETNAGADSHVDVSSWTVTDVDIWLEQLGEWTEPHRQAFHDVKIDGSWLLLLDEELLQSHPLNVDMKLTARRFHNEIQTLKQKSVRSNTGTGATSTPGKDDVYSTGDPSITNVDSPEDVEVTKQKLFVLVLGLLHFPRTISAMGYAVLDYDQLVQFLTSVNVMSKERLEEIANTDGSYSWWFVTKMTVLPQFAVLQEMIRSGAHIEGIARWLVVVLIIRMYQELKIYFVCLRLLGMRNFAGVSRLAISESCVFARDFTMVVTIGYLYNILPGTLIDVYTAYILGQPVGSAVYSGLRLLYRRVPLFRNAGMRMIRILEQSVQIAMGYVLRFVFGWLIPHVIRVLEPAFRPPPHQQAAAGGGAGVQPQPHGPAQPNQLPVGFPQIGQIFPLGGGNPGQVGDMNQLRQQLLRRHRLQPQDIPVE